MLRRLFPNVRGLVDPNLHEIKTYIDLHGGQDCIFILNVPEYAHWVTISNKNCNDGEWVLYDSMKVSYDQLKPIFSRIFPDREIIFIRRAIVTQQKNGHDCRLYALAISTILAADQDPETKIVDESKLRNHYRNCIRNQEASLFPSKERRRKVIVNNFLEVEL